jgi:hypothetical protein
MFHIEGMCNKVNFIYILNFEELQYIFVSGVSAIILHNFRVPSAKKSLRTTDIESQYLNSLARNV